MRNLVSGEAAPFYAYNAEVAVKNKIYRKGVIFMPNADGDVLGIPLDNYNNGIETVVTVPNQIAGVWCSVVFAKIDTTSEDGLISHIHGLKYL